MPAAPRSVDGTCAQEFRVCLDTPRCAASATRVGRPARSQAAERSVGVLMSGRVAPASMAATMSRVRGWAATLGDALQARTKCGTPAGENSRPPPLLARPGSGPIASKKARGAALGTGGDADPVAVRSGQLSILLCHGRSGGRQKRATSSGASWSRTTLTIASGPSSLRSSLKSLRRGCNTITSIPTCVIVSGDVETTQTRRRS